MGRVTARMTRGEWLLLGLLAAWSLIPLAQGIIHLIQHGGVLSGTDGIGVVDHFQYLSWIRDAGENGLVSNRYDVADSDAVYLQPMWLISGLAWAAGLPIQAGLLLWKPVCVALLFGGSLAYVRRLVEGRGAQVAALALALFYLPPLAVLMNRTGIGGALADSLGYLFGFQLSPATYLWGYVQTAVAVGLMPVFLLALERRRIGWAAAAGLLVSWVHPWQGIVLLGVLAGIAVWCRLVRPLVIPAIATGVPLVYFLALARVDEAWAEGSKVGSIPHHFDDLLLAVGPLAAFAVAGVVVSRGRELDFQERALLLWPVVTLVVYALLDRTFIYNVLSGLTIPLAILAVRGAARLPRWAAVAAVVVATVPGLVNLAVELRDNLGAFNSPRYFEPGEADALRFVDESPREGAVLTRLYLGQAVPAFTGRRTYVGHPSWSPDIGRRVTATENLFSGRLTRAQARALVDESGVAFVVQDCVPGLGHDLSADLGPMVRAKRRFGCAAVYEVG